MKNVYFILVLLISLPSFSQQTDFTIPAGTQKTLVLAEQTLSLKTFNLGDDCTIIIPSTMSGWTVTADDVTIGKNVRIIGQGTNGASGANGTYGAIGASCQMGMNGAVGGNGSNGVPGKNVSLTLRIRKIGSLTINVIGGMAGNGGAGGNGGKGGNATCSCDAGTGGNGGNGGRGGNGGSGGNVTILYSSIGNVAVSNSNFIIQNFGGANGMGKNGGYAGYGGTGGGCSDPKALVRPAGASGKNGIPGLQGSRGANGVTVLQRQ